MNFDVPAGEPGLWWQTAGRCVTADPDLFVGGGDHDAALRLCRDCPVQLTCRAHAVENGELGVWGGQVFR